jgi:hypothetical protein
MPAKKSLPKTLECYRPLTLQKTDYKFWPGEKDYDRGFLTYYSQANIVAGKETIEAVAAVREVIDYADIINVPL